MFKEIILAIFLLPVNIFLLISTKAISGSESYSSAVGLGHSSIKSSYLNVDTPFAILFADAESKDIFLRFLDVDNFPGILMAAGDNYLEFKTPRPLTSQKLRIYMQSLFTCLNMDEKIEGLDIG